MITNEISTFLKVNSNSESLFCDNLEDKLPRQVFCPFLLLDFLSFFSWCCRNSCIVDNVSLADVCVVCDKNIAFYVCSLLFSCIFWLTEFWILLDSFNNCFLYGYLSGMFKKCFLTPNLGSSLLLYSLWSFDFHI